MFQIAFFIIGICAALAVIGLCAGLVLGIFYPLAKMLIRLFVAVVLGITWAMEKLVNAVDALLGRAPV